MNSTDRARLEVYVTIGVHDAPRAPALVAWLVTTMHRNARLVPTPPITGTAVVAIEVPPERHRQERDRAFDHAYYAGMAVAWLALTREVPK